MKNKSSFPEIPDAREWPLATPRDERPQKNSEAAWPRISVVTPSFNQGAYLEKTIRSVLLQGYPNLEYIVIDGGSTDQSLEIIKKYESWIDFWVSEKDRGQSHAINKGFERATGDLLGWLNSDDYFTPEALFTVAKHYADNTGIGALFGKGHIVDPSGRIVVDPKAPEVTLDNLFGWFAGGAEFMQPSCLFTRQAWLECGPLAEDLHYAMDLDLWIKIAKKYNFKRIDDLISISLRHGSAKTHACAEESLVDVAFVYMRHGREDKARKVLQRIVDRMVEYKRELAVAGKIPLLRRFLRAAIKVKGNTDL